MSLYQLTEVDEEDVRQMLDDDIEVIRRRLSELEEENEILRIQALR